jgi:hypothetical protein
VCSCSCKALRGPTRLVRVILKPCPRQKLRHLPRLEHMMVGFISFIRTIFCCCTKPTTMDDTPPPEYKQVCDPSVTSEKSPNDCSRFLNPGLRFTAGDIESQLVVKDATFASAVVELMLPRLTAGVWQELVGWGHYSYTLDKVSLSSRRLTSRKRPRDVILTRVNATKRPDGTTLSVSKRGITPVDSDRLAFWSHAIWKSEVSWLINWRFTRTNVLSTIVGEVFLSSGMLVFRGRKVRKRSCITSDVFMGSPVHPYDLR